MANRTSATNPETREQVPTIPVPAKAGRKHLMWGLRRWEQVYREVLLRPDVAGDTAKADAYMRGLASAIRTMTADDLNP